MRHPSLIVTALAVGLLALLVCGRLLQSIAPSGSVTIPLPAISFPVPEFSALAALVLLAVGLGIHGWTKLAPRKVPVSRAVPVDGSNVVQFPRRHPARRGERVGRIR
jgi:hypothetical protein